MSLSTLINQKNYEQIKFTMRRHPITFLPFLLLFTVLIAAPVALYFFIFQNLLTAWLENTIFYVLGVLLGSAYYLTILVFFYTYFVEFHLDLWIITNDRLLDIQQKSIFARTISEVDLYLIQDASSEVHGFFPTIFNYGNISFQTAGPVPKFIFRNVSNPSKIREAVLNLSAEDKKFHQA